MHSHRVIIRLSEGLCQELYLCSLRVLIRLWKTYRLFPQVLWKTISNCETLCCSNCVVPETYVGGLLTFMRSCDSLPAKITRSQRLFEHINTHSHQRDHKQSEEPQREHKRESFHTSLIFLAIFLIANFPQLFPQRYHKAVENSINNQRSIKDHNSQHLCH